jgi:hypothetical protein
MVVSAGWAGPCIVKRRGAFPIGDVANLRPFDQKINLKKWNIVLDYLKQEGACRIFAR